VNAAELVIHNPPPSHTLLMVVAFIGDGIVIFGIAMTWLSARATARPACTCDRGEDA
jgi:hypothetical protein